MKKLVFEIPACTQHEGYPGNLIKVEISANCPICGGPRAGEVFRGLSFDGSRRLNVDCWVNQCGHVDTYSAIRDGIHEGINKIVPYSTPTYLDQIHEKA